MTWKVAGWRWRTPETSFKDYSDTLPTHTGWRRSAVGVNFVVCSKRWQRDSETMRTFTLTRNVAEWWEDPSWTLCDAWRQHDDDSSLTLEEARRQGHDRSSLCSFFSPPWRSLEKRSGTTAEYRCYPDFPILSSSVKARSHSCNFKEQRNMNSWKLWSYIINTLIYIYFIHSSPDPVYVLAWYLTGRLHHLVHIIISSSVSPITINSKLTCFATR